MPGLTAADVLAGPILRRADAQRVCVWVALARPAQVTLQVFAGRGRRAELAAPLPAAPTAPGSFENRTLAVGAQLHVALAVFEPLAPARLDWGTLYSYDLRLATAEGTQGLAELGLLQDHAALPGLDGVPHPHLALGYDEGVLPSFVLPPLQPRDLRVAHGSCRGHGLEQRDALALLDDLVARAQLDPAARIHQLLLTGDQVYADAVSPELLMVLSPIANRLLGGNPQVAVETIPVDLALDPAQPNAIRAHDVPVDMHHLPASRRTHVMNDLGGGSSTEADSHMLGFGEVAALYLTAWAGTTWPDLQARLAARWDRVEDYRRATAVLMAATRDRLAPGGLGDGAWKAHGGPLRERVACFEAWRLLPPELRAIDHHLDDADRAADWLPPDDPAPPPTGRKYHWPDFWAGDTPAAGGPDYRQPPVTAPHEVPFEPPSSRDPLQAALARALTPSWYAGRHAWRADISFDSAHTPGASDRVLHDAGRYQLGQMQVFLDDVPRVRRVLANTPTLMMFDDHEVSDDWNITARWVRRTYGSSLGRAMVRNMLCAYALFQHWGNDPEAFRDPARPGHKLLTQIARMFLDGGAPRSAGPPAGVRNELDRLLDLRAPVRADGAPEGPGPIAPAPTPPEQRVHWHWRYQGAQYELIALDSRTWRTFEAETDPEIGQPVSDQASASLISDESLPMQLPDAPAPGSVLTLVIASAPFIGMPVAENIVQPTLNASDSVRLPAEPPFVRRQGASRPGRLRKDPEPFGFVPRLFEAVLARLANRRRVVFLSGDVHYSLMLGMSYWRFGPEPLATRFVQLISSSLRAPRGQGNMELFTMDALQQLGGLTSQQSRLGWVRPRPGEPAVLPGGDADLSFRVRRLLGEDPIVLPADGLPAGTATAPVQWAWRLSQLADGRSDALRTQGLEPPPVQATLEGDPGSAALALARRHRWQSENMPPRRWQWWTNVCTVDFAAEGDGGLKVRQHVYARDLDGVARTPVDRIVTEASLEVGAELPPVPGAG